MKAWDGLLESVRLYGLATTIVLAAMVAMTFVTRTLWAHYRENWRRAQDRDDMEAMQRVSLYAAESGKRQELIGLQIAAAQRQERNVIVAMEALHGMGEELKAMREELGAMRVELQLLREVHERHFQVVDRMEAIVARLMQATMDAHQAGR